MGRSIEDVVRNAIVRLAAKEEEQKAFRQQQADEREAVRDKFHEVFETVVLPLITQCVDTFKVQGFAATFVVKKERNATTGAMRIRDVSLLIARNKNVSFDEVTPRIGIHPEMWTTAKINTGILRIDMFTEGAKLTLYDEIPVDDVTEAVFTARLERFIAEVF